MSINRFPIKTIIFLLFAVALMVSAQLPDDSLIQEQEIRAQMRAQQQQEAQQMRAQCEQELQQQAGEMRAQYEQEAQLAEAKAQAQAKAEAQAALDQQQFEAASMASIIAAGKRYPQLGDPNSELTKKYLEIVKRLADEKSPTVNDSNAAKRIAEMAAGELKIAAAK